MLLDATSDATAGVVDASKLVARAVAPGMSGSVFDGKPEAIALTVPLAEADADAVADEVADVVDEAELDGEVVLCPDPAVGPLQAAKASAAEASTVAPASR